MKTKKIQTSGTMLTTEQLKRHLKNIAAEQNIILKSAKTTYPVPQMLENFKIIQNVYSILNKHLKLGINIHPAGEWILDNLYVIEETVKMIQKELTLKKYINFPGISNRTHKGFARIYILSSEIISYTEARVERENLEQYLISYQTKKTLSMDEIWNIGIFLKIAIIEKIAEICKKIYNTQMQKYTAELIVERIIEENPKNKRQNKSAKLKEIDIQNTKYSFIEYMSYILKRYGKKGYNYLNALEEIVEMTGTTISEIIKKEHFDIANKKVLIGNGIISIKKIQRLNFLEMFEKINGVEDLLKQDPAEVYEKMDYKTREDYRVKIKEISSKTKISEIYITKKILEISKQKEKGSKQSHIGYYIIGNGINELYQNIGYKIKCKKTSQEKTKRYISVITILSIIVAIIMTYILKIRNIYIYVLSMLIFIIPATEVVVQIIQWVLVKTIKPKMIPKLNMENKISKENATMVVIPTILNNKEKAKGLIDKLEVFYLANKSKNIYFTLLGDCTRKR